MPRSRRSKAVAGVKAATTAVRSTRRRNVAEPSMQKQDDDLITLLGPLCYKLITIVNFYLETGLTCFVYCPKALYLFIFIVWLPL